LVASRISELRPAHFSPNKRSLVREYSHVLWSLFVGEAVATTPFFSQHSAFAVSRRSSGYMGVSSFFFDLASHVAYPENANSLLPPKIGPPSYLVLPNGFYTPQPFSSFPRRSGRRRLSFLSIPPSGGAPFFLVFHPPGPFAFVFGEKPPPEDPRFFLVLLCP